MSNEARTGSEVEGCGPPGEAVVWHDLSDDELARRCRTELAGCVDELVQRYDARIRDCARRMALDPANAEDVVQEIFLRLITALPRFQGRSAVSTWVYRIAHNTCIDSFRRDMRAAKRRAQVGPDGDPDAVLASLPARWGDPEDAIDDQIRECYLGWVLSQLPDDYREIVRLRLGEGRSNEDVAELLGTSVDSVKAKLRRARQRLRELLLAGDACPVCGVMGAFRVGVDAAVE